MIRLGVIKNYSHSYIRGLVTSKEFKNVHVWKFVNNDGIELILTITFQIFI